jgi:ferritin-like metal-binding protein YciE
MHIDSLQDLFVYRLRQQYYVETKLVEILDEMAERANNGRLRQGFVDHRDETRTQVERLEAVFDEIDVRAEPETDPVLDALDQERRSLEGRIEDDDMLDTVYLNAGLMTERIEMTAYEGLSMLATELEFGDAVHRPLESNHDEERSTYEQLNTLAAASEMKSLWDRLTLS